MEQFNLEEWLKDKSRKVVTIDGKPVRIVCTDLKNNYPIIAAIKGDNSEMPYYYDINGNLLFYDSKDIFFADEEEELTEFEEQLASILFDREYEGKTNTEDDIERSMLPYRLAAKEYSQELLDLARKELEKIYYLCNKDDSHWEDGYKKGKQDALESLPKWKKTTEKKEMDDYVALYEDEERVVLSTELCKGEYYLELNDLKTLPKEE